MASPSAEKFRDDEWSSSPPQVTSFITYPHSHQTLSAGPTGVYTSPICGFGWRFELSKRSYYQTSSSNARIQELVGEVNLIFDPHLCSSMRLSSVGVTVKVSYPTADEVDFRHTQVFSNVGINSKKNRSIGSYSEPPQYKGKTYIQVTIAFDPSDGLSLPNSSSTNTKKALRRSLDAPSFADTKFYLFTSKVDGRPARPKALFAKSELLIPSSGFLKDLLSHDMVFSTGTACDLFEDVPEEVAKLKADDFEYDSDSDLGADEESPGKGKGKNSAGSVPEEGLGESSRLATTGNTGGGLARGRAYAINGTAYKTWKAFIFYTYTNDVVFNKLRSQRSFTEVGLSSFDRIEDESDSIKCSPKSMYRFADYADIPVLKSLAKEAIRKRLSKSNIITELFSSFTHRYQEIIGLEVDFLVENFTTRVARQLDEMLQMAVLGTKPHSFRVLAFAMRRLRGDSATVAWGALDPAPGPDFASTPVPQPPSPPAASVNEQEACVTPEPLGPTDRHLKITNPPTPINAGYSSEVGASVPQTPVDFGEKWSTFVEETKEETKEDTAPWPAQSSGNGWGFKSKTRRR